MATTVAWTKSQVQILIEAYREEPSLYVVKHPNYHNKHLLNAALERLAVVVGQHRPGVTAKEIQTKMHSLRNQFNVENAKRKSSLNKSGNGTADVYTPSLWYFSIMAFLGEHYVPRKSKASRIGEGETSSIGEHPVTTNVTSEGLDGNGVLRVYDDMDVTQFLELSESEAPESIIPSSRSSSPSILTPGQPPATSTQVLICPQSAPPLSQNIPVTPSTSSHLTPPNKRLRANKRKAHDESDYVSAIQAIAETLKEPERPPERPTDPVDSCMNFLGSVLKTYKNKKLQIDVMSKLVQTVLTAKNEEDYD